MSVESAFWNSAEEDLDSIVGSMSRTLGPGRARRVLLRAARLLVLRARAIDSPRPRRSMGSPDCEADPVRSAVEIARD